jgi:hypothetical protein
MQSLCISLVMAQFARIQVSFIFFYFSYSIYLINNKITLFNPSLPGTKILIVY